jgi:uncharacterized protein (TIGR03437 family)
MVRVNGVPAALSFISPNQVNFQVPGDGGIGQAPVEIHRDGRPLVQFRVNRDAIAPGMFVYHDGGRDFAAAAHTDGTAITTAAPASPGETILIYGTGFGPTDPPVTSGRVFNGAAPTTAPVRLWIGDSEAKVDFAGLVSPGLYQINAVVPDLPPADHPVRVDAGGHAAQNDVYLPIGMSTGR